MFNWLAERQQWLFGGVGATILIAILKYLFLHIEKYIYNHVIKNKQNEVDKKVEARLGEILVQSPLIEVEIKIDEDDVEFYCVTYRRNETREKQYDFIWVENAKFKIARNKNGFVLRKKEINDNLKDPSDPYKFYMVVPNNQDKINKYYLRLIKSRHVVTGCGTVDEDQKRWRIWFLVSGEPIHPDTHSPTLINHTLVNQISIRNILCSSVGTEKK